MDGLTVSAWHEHTSSLHWRQAGSQDMTHTIRGSQAHQQGLHSLHMISWQVTTVCDLIQDVECTYTCPAALGQHSHQHWYNPCTTASLYVDVVAIHLTQMRQNFYAGLAAELVS